MKGTMVERDSIPDLLWRAKQGERAAFDALILRSTERLAALVRRRIRADLRERLEVDGIVNDTFGRAFSSLARFTGNDEDAWFGWLAGIAKHVVLKEIEQLGRGRAFHLAREPADDPASPSRAMRREERFGRLCDAVDQLSEDHREVVRLCRLEGLSIRETASRMERSPAAVKMLLSRALKSLKEKFGDTQSLNLPDRPLHPRGERHGE